MCGDPRSVEGAGPSSAPESSGRGKNAGTGSGQDGFRIGTIAGTHLALTSSRPGHTRVSSHHLNGRGNDRGRTHRSPPSRRSFGTARRIRTISGSHLGSTLGSGKSCPDPGRLSTFGVSGLYPCRRLTYRGACLSMLAPRPAARQTPYRIPYATTFG